MRARFTLVIVLVFFCFMQVNSQALAQVSNFEAGDIHNRKSPGPDFFTPSSFSLCTITCSPDITVNNDPGVCTAVVTASDVILEGDCNLSSLTWEMTGSTTGTGTGQIGSQVYNVGQTTVVFTIDDSFGDPATCSFDVTVIDTEPPAIICPTDTSIICPEDYFPPDPSQVVATDNCGLDTVYCSNEDITFFPVPCFVPTSIVRTYLALDQAGNMASCTREITVIDTNCNCVDCSDITPHFNVNLVGNPDSSWWSVPYWPVGISRDGLCCNDATWPDKCISFGITLDTAACGIFIAIPNGALPGGDMYWQIFCGDNIPITDTIWLEPGMYYHITFCAPGDNPNQYVINSIPCTVTGNEEIAANDLTIRVSPNPVTTYARILYQIKEPGAVTLAIYNKLGQNVGELVDQEQGKGSYEVTWNSENQPPGIYFYRLQAGNQVITGKLIVCSSR
jgi:hypothetical protein